MAGTARGELRVLTKSSRPFYGEFAWAYNLLIDRPVQRECAAIATWLVDRGVVPGSTLLDAGCGTGRYSLELSRRGYRVRGIDASADLIDEARRAAGSRSPHVSFEVGDILTLSRSTDDAVLCRGVLNDVIDDEDRGSVFAAFARALRDDGILILDVREWEATAARKEREPLFRKRVDTDRGRLTFTSVTDLDPETRRLLVTETHTLEAGGRLQSWDNEFVMRCWTMVELDSLLRLNGFTSIAYFGAYDPAVARGATDRLVVVARHSGGRQ
jgi:SAM-dependent methyltransferase